MFISFISNYIVSRGIHCWPFGQWEEQNQARSTKMYQLNSNQKDTRGRTLSLALSTHHSNRLQNSRLQNSQWSKNTQTVWIHTFKEGLCKNSMKETDGGIKFLTSSDSQKGPPKAPAVHDAAPFTPARQGITWPLGFYCPLKVDPKWLFFNVPIACVHHVAACAPMSLPNPAWSPSPPPCPLKVDPKGLFFPHKMFRSIWAQVSRFYGRKWGWYLFDRSLVL